MKMNVNPVEFFNNMNQMGMQMMCMMKPKFNNQYADMFKQQAGSFCNLAQGMRPNMEEMNELNQLMANYTAQMFEMTKQMTENMYKQNMQMLEGMNKILQNSFESRVEKVQEVKAASKTAAPKKTTAKKSAPKTAKKEEE